MDRKEKEVNIYDLISETVQDLLVKQLRSKNSGVPIKKVIEILLKIEQSVPEVIVDGDEMVKYFSKKSH
jgi:hypothetical protein